MVDDSPACCTGRGPQGARACIDTAGRAARTGHLRAAGKLRRGSSLPHRAHPLLGVLPRSWRAIAGFVDLAHQSRQRAVCLAARYFFTQRTRQRSPSAFDRSSCRHVSAGPAASTASATEATRDCSESAREVSTIGTRAAEHEAGAVAAADVDEALVEHVAGVQVGHQQQVGVAGDLRGDALDARGLGRDRRCRNRTGLRRSRPATRRCAPTRPAPAHRRSPGSPGSRSRPRRRSPTFGAAMPSRCSSRPRCRGCRAWCGRFGAMLTTQSASASSFG